MLLIRNPKMSGILQRVHKCLLNIYLKDYDIRNYLNKYACSEEMFKNLLTCCMRIQLACLLTECDFSTWTLININIQQLQLGKMLVRCIHILSGLNVCIYGPTNIHTCISTKLVALFYILVSITVIYFGILYILWNMIEIKKTSVDNNVQFCLCRTDKIPIFTRGAYIKAIYWRNISLSLGNENVSKGMFFKNCY